MTMPEPVNRTDVASSAPIAESPESLELTPVCGPLAVEETTDPAVVPFGDQASIEKDAAGNQFFCLRNLEGTHASFVAPVYAPAGRSLEGPWMSEPVTRGNRLYLAQVSSIFAEESKITRLYGIMVPVSVQSESARTYDMVAEEPIVVWGSEDEGEGPDGEESIPKS